MEQLVILLIIGGISLVKWLLEKSAEMREQKKTQERIDRLGRDEPAPAQPEIRSDREESVRKFLEALGLPADSAPPERPPIRPVPPIIESPIPRAFIPEPVAEPVPQPPPLVLQAEDLERRLVEARKLAADLKRQTTARKKPASGPVVPAATRVDSLLRSRGGLRQAMIAREILGPPKGLSF